MRNWRELTSDEVRRLECLYPVTTNRELSRMFDISVDGIQDHFAKPLGWKKDKKSISIGNRNGHTLNEKEISWMIKHFKHTKNEDIMRKFGIGEAQLHRVARKYGLKKSRQQHRKNQQNATANAYEVCRKYGIYEELRKKMREVMRGYAERGERHPSSFKPGESNKNRLSPERFIESIQKTRKKRNETIMKERRRILFGLPQKTKMVLHYAGYGPIHRKKSIHRSLFRKYGYIVDRGSSDIYFDELTVRRPQMEANAVKYGFRIIELEQ